MYLTGPKTRTTSFLAIIAVISVTLTVVIGQHLSEWADPVSAESLPGTGTELNTSFNDGCPYQSPDGLSLFMATNRPGGLGGQDIWIATRSSVDEPFGDPVNPGAPINSSADDFCPSPVRGHGLFFVSARSAPDACGGPDIYFTREKHGEWEEPQNLGCTINSPAAEWSPSYFEDDYGNAYFYFASTRPGGFEPGGTDADIYFSVNFGEPQLAPGLNTAFNDFRPNVRKDGREIVFDSDRPGTLGGFDIWTATRDSIFDAWSAPVHLPAPINSPANETRASLSWDGLTMYFGSNRAGGEGMSDIYVTTRERSKGRK
jgi:hypothetical protein